MSTGMAVLGVTMAILGHLIHLLKKVVEIRASGQKVGLIEFIKERPYRTAMGMAGSAAAMGYLFESGDVSAMTALGIGYMADSGLSVLDQREGSS